jgi:hypothetical protein
MGNADELKGSIVGGKGDCKDNCRDENMVADREDVSELELEDLVQQSLLPLILSHECESTDA